jgi:hypothetical protein
MVVHVKKASNMRRTCCGRPVAGLVVRRWEPTLAHLDVDCKACRRAWQAEREQQEEIEQAQEWLEPEENPLMLDRDRILGPR